MVLGQFTSKLKVNGTINVNSRMPLIYLTLRTLIRDGNVSQFRFNDFRNSVQTSFVIVFVIARRLILNTGLSESSGSIGNGCQNALLAGTAFRVGQTLTWNGRIS